MQALLRFILVEKKFAKIDSKAIQAAVKAEQQKKGGLGIAIADAPTTVVRVNVKGTEHAVEYYALSFAANQYPAVEPLQEFNAVAKRLQNVMNVAKGGGKEKVSQMLKLANAELKKQHPDAKPLTLEHLQSAFTNRDGSKRYSFGWNKRGTPEKPGSNTFVNVSVVESKDGATTVTARAKL